jgi:hypothetical protein
LQGINTGGDIGNTDPLIKSVVAMAMFLGRLVGGAAFGTSAPPLKELINNIQTIGQAGIESAGPKMLKNTELLGKLFNAVSQSANNFSAMEANVTRATADIQTKGIDSALKAVNQMIDVVQKLDTALTSADLNKLDISAKLGRVAQGVGLGKTASYTVNAGKPVVITLNLNVSMDVDQVEKVMILRSTSIIRDRLDLANTKPDAKIDNPLRNYTPGDNVPAPNVSASGK